MTVNWNGSDLLAKIHAAAVRGLHRGVEEVRTEAVTLMQNSPRGGRVYRRGGVSHKASAPGEPPAPDTGFLMRSIGTSVDPETLVGTVSFTARYARALEYGTARMAARPFARPALANKIDDIQADIAAEISAALK